MSQDKKQALARQLQESFEREAKIPLKYTAALRIAEDLKLAGAKDLTATGEETSETPFEVAQAKTPPNLKEEGPGLTTISPLRKSDLTLEHAVNFFWGITGAGERLGRVAEDYTFLIKGGPGCGKTALFDRLYVQASIFGFEITCISGGGSDSQNFRKDSSSEESRLSKLQKFLRAQKRHLQAPEDKELALFLDLEGGIRKEKVTPEEIEVLKEICTLAEETKSLVFVLIPSPEWRELNHMFHGYVTCTTENDQKGFRWIIHVKQGRAEFHTRLLNPGIDPKVLKRWHEEALRGESTS